MIGKVSRGWRVGGLIRYLMGPGRFNEHRNQRVIATWDHAPELHQPAPLAEGEGFDCTELAAELADPQVAAGIPQHEPAAGATGKHPRGPVWHCSLRNHADDRVLSDEEWAEIAREVMDRTGIAPHDDPGACRWAVVRHAEDHIHIAAVLVRQDTGRLVHPQFDFRRVREVCQESEQRLGLSVTAAADRTATQIPTRAEQEKAARRQEPVTSREQLQRAARLAAVRAQGVEAFLADLEERGLHTRAHSDENLQTDGYSLAVPGDVNGEGEPVWYSGQSLGRDLSLPQLRAQWASARRPPPPIPPEPTERSRVGRKERSEALSEATAATERAAERLARGDFGDADGIAHATRDMLAAFADVAAGPYPELSAAAMSYDRAARTPREVLPRKFDETSRALRTAAWRLSAVGVLTGRGRDAAPTARLLVALAALAVEVAAYQATRERLAQASAAERCADRLRAAAPDRPPRQARGGTTGPTVNPQARTRTRDAGPTTPGVSAPGPHDAERGGPADRGGPGRGR